VAINVFITDDLGDQITCVVAPTHGPFLDT